MATAAGQLQRTESWLGFLLNVNYAACALEETPELFAAFASGGISLLKEDQIRIFGNVGFVFCFGKGKLIVHHGF